MAHLFLRDAESYAVLPLNPASDLYLLPDAEQGRIRVANGDAAGANVLLRIAAPPTEQWAIVTPPHSELRINGQWFRSGIKTLDHRDEIKVGAAESFFFSTERRAAVVPFAGASHPISCPLCKLNIEVGDLAVTCPGCQVLYHQKDDLLCWTLRDKCLFCPQPTSLDAGFSWTPEGL